MGTTAHYNWTLPTVGSDSNTWGGELNTTTNAIDAQVYANQQTVAAIQGQLNANNLTLARTASLNGTITFNNSVAPSGQQVRWTIFGADTEAESGANAGTNFQIVAYSDAGAYLGPALTLNRATGSATFVHAVTVQGAFTANSTLGVSGLLTATAGANITGQLAVNGNILGNICYFGWPGVSDFLANVAGTLRYIQWYPNWWDGWDVSGGLRTWVAAGTQIMSLDGSGNLAVTGGVSANGAINASSFATSGSIAANGNVTANTGFIESAAGLVLSKAAGSGNANFVMEDNTGATRGYCYWAAAANSVSLLNLATSNSYQLMPGGDCYATPGTAANNFVVTQGTGLKPGGGSWGSWSDARIKSVTGDYASGLEAVLQLRPVTYVYKGDYAARSGGKEFVGLVADEAMKVLPEMVSLQKGTIDGREVDDLKVLDTTSLIFALVNAVKELKAEIEVLKASK